MRYESTEQIILMARIRHFHPDTLAFAIPNGGKRDPKEAVRLKKEGVLAGVPDVCVAEPRGTWHGLYIEMKRQKGGKVSPEQQQIHDKLVKRGYKVVVAEGVEPAYKAFLEYISC